MNLHLVSHHLCPYVQRAAIALAEKDVPFERTFIDLADKPGWFLRISPLGKTPVLLADDVAIFESAVILEYLEDTQPNPLHPGDPLRRARDRAWMEFGSAVLNDIAGFYSAPDDETFAAKTASLRAKLARLESEIGSGPYFEGTRFSLVDTVFGPVFRYFDTFDGIGDFGVLTGLPKLANWRYSLARRASVRDAVSAEYPTLLKRFIEQRGSRLSAIMMDGVPSVDLPQGS
mgnify:CR=1 FL=1